MITNTVDVLDLKRKLYQKYKDFNKFSDIDEERQEELRNEIAFLVANYERLDLYIKVVQSLLAYRRSTLSFDEKMFCLIEACDPNLVFLKTFQKFGSPKKGDVEYDQYINAVRESCGFRDDNLRKFESFYYRNIILKKQSQEEVKTLSRTKNK